MKFLLGVSSNRQSVRKTRLALLFNPVVPSGRGCLGWGCVLGRLHDPHDDPRDSALALRFLGAVHRLVLPGKALQLAACYPSVGGDSNSDDFWLRFRDVVENHEVVLGKLVHRPIQTNEVGRRAALLGGFLAPPAALAR